MRTNTIATGDDKTGASTARSHYDRLNTRRDLCVFIDCEHYSHRFIFATFVYSPDYSSHMCIVQQCMHRLDDYYCCSLFFSYLSIVFLFAIITTGWWWCPTILRLYLLHSFHFAAADTYLRWVQLYIVYSLSLFKVIIFVHIYRDNVVI